MKTDEELNCLVATALLHWKIKDGYYLNSHSQKRFALHEYQPLSNQAQFEELADKMKARDYQLVIKESKTAGGMYEVAFTKYGETFSATERTISRAGTIAALKAYQQLD